MAIVSLLSAVLVSTVTMAASLAITPTAVTVTVRRGERLQMSCDISPEHDGDYLDLEEARWYRGSNTSPYGSLHVSSCGFVDLPCSTANTTDNRGIVQYSLTGQNIGTMTLTIASSVLGDSAIFKCAISVHGVVKIPAPISVTVYFLPNKTYPSCTTSYVSETIPSAVLCSSEITQPVVSLEWTTLVNLSRISLSRNTTIVGDQVENALYFRAVDSSYNNSVFTCIMTSEAYPEFNRSCSVGPVTIFPTPTPEVTGYTTPEQSSLESLDSAPSTAIQTTSDQGESSSIDQITISRITQTTVFTAHNPFSSTVTITIASISVVTIIILLIIIAYQVASKRKLKKNFNHIQTSLRDSRKHSSAKHTSTQSSNANGDTQQQPGGISLQSFTHDGPGASNTNSSLNSSHEYETSILGNSRRTPATVLDQRTVRPQQPSTNDGYTPYIVPDQAENSANNTVADAGYMPLAIYEQI